MKRIAGTLFFKIGGDQLETTVEGKCEASLFDWKREAVKPGYYKENIIIPSIKGDFLFTPKFPKNRLLEDDMVIVANFANGMTCTLIGATVVGDMTVSNADGTISLEFNGNSIDWN